MLRLGSCVLTHLVSSPATYAAKYPASYLHRLISAAAAAPVVSPTPSFAVEDYLVTTCGLTRAQALKAFPKLSHLKSSSKPDAVLAFLAGVGLSGADIVALVAKDPQFLCASVDRTLAHNMVRLTGVGLSHTEISRLVLLAPVSFRCRSTVSKLPYYLSLFGSYENLLRVLRGNSYLLASNLSNAVKPNVEFLRECGLGACDISKLVIRRPRLLTSKLERLQAMVASAEGLGPRRGSRMFTHALQAVSLRSEETIAAKVEYLKKALRWSDAEAGIAVCTAPKLVTMSKQAVQIKADFLISDVGLAPAYIAQRSPMLMYSLEGRIRPRYYVFKFLKEEGLLHQDRSYWTTLNISEKAFMEKFICPHMEAAPHLAQDYAAACRGKVPTRFKFT